MPYCSERLLIVRQTPRGISESCQKKSNISRAKNFGIAHSRAETVKKHLQLQRFLDFQQGRPQLSRQTRNHTRTVGRVKK
jgi:hypothetical protein